MRFQLSAMQAAIAVLALGATLPAAVHAQSSQGGTQRIEVTGSNIKRVDAETASPIEVVTREDIKLIGANTVRQVLNSLTVTDLGELSDNGSRTSFASGATGVGLRGLGKGATLVLLNGRRLANYGLADGAKDTFVNIDSIPVDIIERVEVLKDGASAVYGSDALAGVINIITRKDYTGAGVGAAYQRATTPAIGAQKTASLVAGMGNLEKDRYNIFANLEFYKRDAFTLADIKDRYPAWHKQLVNPSFGDPSTTSYPGNFFGNLPGSTRTPHPACTTKNTAGACVTDLTRLTQASDPAERVNFYSGWAFNLSPKVQLFGDVQVSRTQTEYFVLQALGSPTVPYRWYDGYVNKLQEVNKPLLQTNNPLNTFGKPAGIEYVFLDPGINNLQPTVSSQYRMLLGARGTFGQWDYEAGYSRLGGEANSRTIGLHRVDFIDAINSNKYVFGGNNSQELLDKMFRTVGIKGENTQDILDARMSGTLLKLPNGKPLNAAFGGEIRRESISIRSSDLILQTQILSRGALFTDASRSQGAVFGEIEGEVLRNLTANAAVRYDKSQGFESEITPKIGLKFKALPNLVLRGTAGQGFRAPNIVETLGSAGVTGFFNGSRDPKRCETATQIRDILATGNANDKQDATAAFNSGCSASMPAKISSNPNLTPERSKSFTLGFVLEPARNISLAVDYFRIERTDEIFYPGLSFVLDREDQARYAGYVTRTAVSPQDLNWAARANELKPGSNIAWGAGSVTTVLLGYENLDRTFTSGVDVEVRGRFDLADAGQLTLGYNATIAESYREFDRDTNKYLDNTVGLRGTPMIRSVLSATLRRQAWTYGFRVSYTSRQQLNFNQFDAPQWNEAGCARTRPNRGDLPCVQYSDTVYSASLFYSGIKNLSLGAQVNNLGGQEVPVDLRGGYSFRPQTVKLSANYSF